MRSEYSDVRFSIRQQGCYMNLPSLPCYAPGLVMMHQDITACYLRAINATPDQIRVFIQKFGCTDILNKIGNGHKPVDCGVLGSLAKKLDAVNFNLAAEEIGDGIRAVIKSQMEVLDKSEEQFVAFLKRFRARDAMPMLASELSIEILSTSVGDWPQDLNADFNAIATTLGKTDAQLLKNLVRIKRAHEKLVGIKRAHQMTTLASKLSIEILSTPVGDWPQALNSEFNAIATTLGKTDAQLLKNLVRIKRAHQTLKVAINGLERNGSNAIL